MPLVAISESQRRWFPDQQLGRDDPPRPAARDDAVRRASHGDYLAFVGRITPEKGIREAIELSRATRHPAQGRRQGHLAPREQAHFDEVVQPAIDADEIDFLGEVGPLERDPLYAGALATVMLGGWPEPFGLVAIESMATGTPVIARRAGALTETIEHGVTGFLVDDVDEAALAVERVAELDRRADPRAHARALLAGQRMADEYEVAYRQVLASPAVRPLGCRHGTPRPHGGRAGRAPDRRTTSTPPTTPARTSRAAGSRRRRSTRWRPCVHPDHENFCPVAGLARGGRRRGVRPHPHGGLRMSRAGLRLSLLDLATVGRDQPIAEALEASVTLARKADELGGFERLWFAEHHNMPAIASAATAVLIAHVAARTTIRVGAGGVMLPNHAPLVIAEQFGTLAELHPGRIDLGLGRAPGTDQ